MTSIFRTKPANVPGFNSEEGAPAGLAAFSKSLRETSAAAPIGTPGAPVSTPSLTPQAPPTQIDRRRAIEMMAQVSGALGRVEKMTGLSVPLKMPSPEALREINRREGSEEGIASFLMGNPVSQALGGLMDTGNLSATEREAEHLRLVGEAERDLAAINADATAAGRAFAAMSPEERAALPTWTPEQAALSSDDIIKMTWAQYEPERQLATERLKTLSATKPRQQMWRHILDTGVRSFLQTGTGFANSVVDLGEIVGAIPFNGGVIEQSPAGQFLDDFDGALVKLFPGDEARKLDFITALASGSGSMLGFWLTGLAAKTVGVSAGTASGVLGGGVGANAAYEDAERYTPEGLKRLVAYLGGGAIGASEAIPIDRMFYRANTLTGGLVERMIKTSVAGSQEEFIQELFQSMSQDVLAKVLYDPGRELDPGAWLTQGAAGGIIGGVTGGATAAFGGGKLSLPDGVKLTPELAQQIADEEFNKIQSGLEAELGDAVAPAGPLEDPTAGAVDQPAADGGGAPGPAAAAPAAEAAPESARPAVAGDAVQQVVARAKPAKTAAPATSAAAPQVTVAEDGTQSVVLDPTVPVEQQVSVQVAPAIETPEFKAWFGQSKVVDETGKPQVVYHGTNAVFREFNPQRQGERDDGFFGNGFYFAEQRESAESYAAGYGEFEGADPPDEIVMETYLALENPFTVDVTSEEALADTIARAQEVLPRIEFDRYGLKGGRTRDWTKALKAAGYDGVVVKQGSTGLENEFVVFEPTQIKSAIGNDGSFDANDPNIDSQVGQPVSPDIVAAVAAVQLDPHHTSPLPDIEKGLTGPIPIVVQAAKAYANAIGLPHRRQRSYVKVDTGRAARIADAYTAMKHEPQDPTVAAAYKAMAEETIAQYQYVKATGIKIETILPNGFAEHMRDAVEDAQVGFYFEEGGCWGMALALNRKMGGELWVTEGRGSTHAYNVVDGVAYDWEGEVKLPASASRVADIVSVAARNGVDSEQVEADAQLAAEIIANATAKADPYPNGPRDVLKDINAGHIWYFPTEGGFGSDASFDASDNPLLEATDEVSDNGQKMVVNDLFRVVHDFFGHGLEGSGFGPRGEENAWQSHMRLFTASAVPAMTSETRGQNSWVNYGPFGEQNRKDPRNTTYADQKTGLMPEWTWTDGVIDSAADDIDAPVPAEAQPFLDAFLAAKEASPFGAAVHAYTAEEYAQMRLFLAPDGLSGFALKGEDIVSVFSHPASGGGRARKIIDVAVANGGRTLDCFDGKLVQIYSALGFREVRRESWNEEYRPDGWQDAWGKPDVVYMEYGGDIEQSVASLGTETPAFLEWDGGAAIRDDDGVPMILYSGAPRAFRKASRAMWLTSDRRTAEQFGDAGNKGGPFKNDAEFDEDGNNIGGAVFTLYARMENPYEYDWEGRMWSEGPETEYPTSYVVDGEYYSSYGDAEQAISDAQDSAREQAEEDFRDDMANRMYVAPVEGAGGAADLFGTRFEVRLKSDNGQLLDMLHDSLAKNESALARTIANRDTAVRMLAEGTAANDVQAVLDDYNNRTIPVITGAIARDRASIAAREAVGDAFEVVGTFDTEEEARDFENEYTEEGATAAGDEAADAVDTDIGEETDYDTDGSGQTTDSVVQYAESAGYDGVIFRDVDEGSGPVDVYVVIEPGNAKSTANFGTYNREDPDILRMTGTSSTRQPYALEPTRPTKGVREPAGTTRAEVPEDQRLTTIGRNLIAVIDAPTRQGRIRGGRDVMGEFNRATGVVRLRDPSDYSTLAHEIGHSLNDRSPAVDAWSKVNRASLTKFALKTYAGDLTQATSTTQLREGVAEFFRVYMTNPQFHRTKQPKLIASFEKALGQWDASTLARLQQLQTQFALAQKHTSVQAVMAMMRSGYREIGLNAALKEINELGFPTWWEEKYRRGITVTTDRFRPLRDMVSKVLNEGQVNRGQSIDLAYADDPRTWAQIGANSQALAMMETKHGVVPYRGVTPASASLRDAIMIAQGASPRDATLKHFDQGLHDEFGAYLIARRALDEQRRYEAGLLDRLPTRLEKGDHTSTVLDLEKRHPEFKQAADMVNDFARALWQKRYDAGMLSKEDYEEGNNRAFYAPLQRDMSDKAGASESFTMGASALTRGPRFKGSNRDIINPADVLETMAFALEREIAENEPIRLLAQLADRAGKSGDMVERIPASKLVGTSVEITEIVRQLAKDSSLSPQDAIDLRSILAGTAAKGNAISFFRSQQASAAGDNVLFFWENGSIAAIQLNDGELGSDVVDLLSGAGREIAPFAMELLSASSNFFRAAIIAHPAYTAANFARGELTAWFTTEGYTPFVSGLRGIWHEFKQTEVARSYNRGMGLLGGQGVAAMRDVAVQRDIEAILPSNYIGQVFSERTLKGAAAGFARLTEFTETGNRLGVYEAAHARALADGMTAFEAQHEAAYIATDMMDYGMHGSRMLAYRRTIPFLNAQIQSLYRFMRTLGGGEVAQRKGLRFALGAYFKGINGLDLSRNEKAQLRVGRKAYVKMVTVGLLSAVLAMLFKDDPDWQDANEYERATHWVLPGWVMGGQAGRVIRIPKPFEWAIFANVMERAIEFADGDSTATDRILRGLSLVLSPPEGPPALSLFGELQANYDTFTGRPIVPNYEQRKPAHLQYDEYTSSLAKGIGGITGLSPYMVDHVMMGLGATWARDIRRIADGVDPAKPSMDAEDMLLLSRFSRDVRGGSRTSADFYALASKVGGSLEQAYAGYASEYARSPRAGEAFLSRLPAADQAYALLNEHYSPEEKRLNPFMRARGVASILNGMRREMQSDLGLSDTTIEDYPEIMPLSRNEKRDVDNILSEISRREMRNTLIAAKAKGWVNKKMLPLDETLALLEATSPSVYDEYIRRSAKAKIYAAEYVFDVWPEAQERLLADRDMAILSDLAAIGESTVAR